MPKRIYFFFFTYMAAMFFAQTLIIFWLSQKGFGFSDLIIYYLISYLVAFSGIFFFPKLKMNSKSSMFWGILFSALTVLVLIRIFSPAQLFLSALFSGLNCIFFWIPYNIMHFKFSHQEKRGLYSGMYFLVSSIIGITLQPLAGFFAEKFGFEMLFLVGVSLYLIPIVLLRLLPNFEWEIDIKKELSELKFNWSTFFQGMVMRTNWSLIPIFTLFYVTTPGAFGNFFGYLALVSAIASVINSGLSDKMESRKIFFYSFSFLAVLSFLPLAFVKDFYYWAIFAGINGLCLCLVNPFWLAANLDYYKNVGVEKTIILREFFLESGFIASLLITLIVFYFTSSPKTALIVVSSVGLLLPVVSYFQGVYRVKIN
ncbi:MAG: hypothetical protein V1484_02865 [bacterium]